MNARVQPQAPAGVAMTTESHEGLIVQRTGSGPLLVLIHGGRGSWNHWIRNIPALSRSYTVLALDLPGFGASLNVPRELPYDDYVGLIARAVRSMTAGAEFRLAGFSFGGQISAALAAGPLRSRVLRASLLAPSGWGGDGQNARTSRKTLKGVTDEAGRLEVLRFNLAATQIADAAKVTDETVALQDYNIGSARYNSVIGGSTPNLLGNLARITCPLQIMLGTRDVLQAPSVEWRIEQMKKAAPHAQVVRLEGAGHWAQYEVPEAYDAALLEFLAQG
jgi:2-hydroxy-6-oxonona-2,4-dienedioate hydrolase